MVVFDQNLKSKSILVLSKKPFFKETPIDETDLFVDGDGQQFLLHRERLMGLARFPGKFPFEFILDTGAHLSLFPYAIWQSITGQIQWLKQEVADKPTRFSIAGIGGASIECQLGIVTVEFLKDSFQRRVVAAYESKSSDLKISLIGLGGNAHIGGGAHQNYDRKLAWLLNY